MILVYVGMGTALGAVARLFITTYLNQTLKKHAFPWSTFIVNMIACFLIGFLTVTIHDSKLKLLLISGFLGGLSTFSTFANEIVTLGQDKTTKKLALLYSCASLGFGIILVYLGMQIYAFV
ncbi:fluoride efflux transporter FluC [Pediococcus pentosaceus]|uniref:Fluoride-specific ion channel FluC n=2 Tax=Pediococcus pentosaceus TaxID=1255 RepID=A0AB73HDS6_PEDPE|nr:CrcB family protein [Pediococcus pentosaceus]KAF0468654.1 camphor resistance protein CrcB [Pediococcus pentosaceus]MBF7114607.1 CrcB family protein [Pediococcus pentosaceus]MBF7128381.1 CrcB family protein [Pediococcus pentosaceus]MBF7132762.1 CrcB family protein [Pediococcus pentosaceus]MCM6792926.1 CrcB family protein [Pediococcus pentosaceus]